MTHLVVVNHGQVPLLVLAKEFSIVYQRYRIFPEQQYPRHDVDLIGSVYPLWWEIPSVDSEGIQQ